MAKDWQSKQVDVCACNGLMKAEMHGCVQSMAMLMVHVAAAMKFWICSLAIQEASNGIGACACIGASQIEREC